MTRNKLKWKIGDIFVIGLNDGTLVVGQVIGQESEILNSVSVAFFDLRLKNPEEIKQIELSPDDIFSVVFSTRDLLDSGKWKVIENRNITVNSSDFPYENLRSSGFIGAKVIGSGILEEFLNAFYALTPWDDWKEPNYLDRLLIDQSKKPSILIYKDSI